jgi:hypothetical protein
MTHIFPSFSLAKLRGNSTFSPYSYALCLLNTFPLAIFK